MTHLRILLADERPERRAMLRSLLSPIYLIVGEADNGQAVAAGCQAWRPDLALVDVELPEAGGIQAARELHAHWPQCRVVLYGSSGEPTLMAAAFAAGASGYVIKGSDRDLFSTIQAVIRQLYWNRPPLRSAGDWSESWVKDSEQGERRVPRSA